MGESIIHDYTYTFIKAEKFNIISNIAVSSQTNLLFQLKNTNYNSECKINITKNSEGISLTYNLEAKQFEQSDLNSNENKHLTIADFDFKMFWIFSVLNNINQKFQIRNNA
ncbi:unnamed protein product [Brachionus calyciflorus]|uniref:Uncharacterized protein n=1 Tax=Brachionus calyciflorus TaxID=104777 RepID=A0A814TCK1_9BILA|nr:unnamed protein product [Brachionus calyciflorus]